MFLFDLQFWFIVVVLTMVFQSIIFDSTAILVHVLLIPCHNNNNAVQVPYEQVHATIDSDTGTYNNDADTCNVDEEWNAHVFYGYLEAEGIQANKWCHTLDKFYVSSLKYFVKYIKIVIQVYVFLVISDVKYHNQL